MSLFGTDYSVKKMSPNLYTFIDAMKQEAHLSARERILEAASRLFYAHGVRATGIDRIIAESGVAKMSFYRNFASKKDLVLTFLEQRRSLWMGWFVRRALQLEREKPEQGLTVLAIALKEWFAETDFRGCPFINIAVEAGDSNADEHRLAQRHKQDLTDFIARMVSPRAHDRAGEIAQLAVLVIDGAIVRAQMTGCASAADEAGVLLGLLEKTLRETPKRMQA
jgi:AcrR family transcriptional regulator